MKAVASTSDETDFLIGGFFIYLNSHKGGFKQCMKL
jgi:hypothetical protein